MFKIIITEPLKSCIFMCFFKITFDIQRYNMSDPILESLLKTGLETIFVIFYISLWLIETVENFQLCLNRHKFVSL